MSLLLLFSGGTVTPPIAHAFDTKAKNTAILTLAPANTSIDMQLAVNTVIDPKLPLNTGFIENAPHIVVNRPPLTEQLYEVVLQKGQYMGFPPFTYSETGTVQSSYNP